MTHDTPYPDLGQLVKRTLNPDMMGILIDIPLPLIYGCIVTYMSVSSQDYLTILRLLDQLFLGRKSTSPPPMPLFDFCPFLFSNKVVVGSSS